MSSHIDYIFKIIIVGDGSIGKSSIMQTFMDNKFCADSVPTIGVEFGSKTITHHNMDIQKKKYEEHKFKLQIWDTSGQDRFRSICKSYYRNTAGIFLVFDLTSYKSFINLDYWIKEVLEHQKSTYADDLDHHPSDKKSDHPSDKKDHPSYKKDSKLLKDNPIFSKRYPPIILIGNKKDLNESLRAVYQDDIDEFIQKNEITTYYETSAKTGEGIKEAFHSMALEIHEHVKVRGSGIDGVTDPRYRKPNWYEIDIDDRKAQKSCCIIS